MQSNDAQIGGPGTPYRATKAAIEALSAVEGAQAYATDTHEPGYYNGTAWVWGAGGGEEHDHDDRYYTQTELQTPGSASVDWQNIANRPALGTGDMEKSDYDADNDGVVDNSQALDGHAAEYFAVEGHTHTSLDDHLVLAASADDYVPGTLYDKISAGTGIQKLVTGANGNLKLSISSHAHPSEYQVVYVDANATPLGSNGSIGNPFTNIVDALQSLKNQVLSNVIIEVAPGIYTNALTVSGFQSTVKDLIIRGDGKAGTKRTLSSGYMYGAGITNDGGAYQGSGSCTLSTDNGGAGGRMRITVNGSVTNPHFSADGIDATNDVVVWSSAAYARYSIYSVAVNVLTLDTFATAPSLNSNGRYIAILPNVEIEYGQLSSDAITAHVPFTLQGCVVTNASSTHSALKVVDTTVQTRNCYFKCPGAGTGSAVLLVDGAKLLTELTPNGAVGGFCLEAVGNCFLDARGFILLTTRATVGRGLSVSFGSTSICDGLKIAIGTPIGVYAEFGSYAGARWFANNAATQYSPPTTDVAGNNSAIITHV